jgi:hypothetical protein
VAQTGMFDGNLSRLWPAVASNLSFGVDIREVGEVEEHRIQDHWYDIGRQPQKSVNAGVLGNYPP